MGFYDNPPVPKPPPIQGGSVPWWQGPPGGGDFGPDPYPSNAGVEDFYGVLRRGNAARVDELSKSGKLTAEQLGYDSAAGSLLNLRSAGYLLPTGYANLGAILAGRGKTDPRRLNNELTDISRTGAANQDMLREEMARLGLSGSGMGMATLGAAGASTQTKRSDAIARDNALAEERQRSDLQLMYDLIIGPSLGTYGALKGVQLGQQQLSQQNKNSMMQLLGLLGAGAMACWVARLVIPAHWLTYRHWLLNMAPPSLRSTYLADGPGLARWLRLHPVWQPGLRRAMLTTLDNA